MKEMSQNWQCIGINIDVPRVERGSTFGERKEAFVS